MQVFDVLVHVSFLHLLCTQAAVSVGRCDSGKCSVMCSLNVQISCFVDVLGTIVVLHAVDGIHEQFPTAAPSTRITDESWVMPYGPQKTESVD